MVFDKHRNRGYADLSFTDEERGYLAGIIDGEGSLRVRYQRQKRPNGSWKRNLMPTVTVTNTNKELIERIIFLTGARNLSTRLTSVGRPCYDLRIQGTYRVYPLLQATKDLLIVKRRQAELLLEFCELRLNRTEEGYSGREIKIREELGLLNGGIRRNPKWKV